VRFASSPAPSQTLAQFGPDLADHLGSAVFRTSAKPVTGGHGFIDGAPAVVLESRGANQLDRPSYQQEWLDIAGVRVSGWLFEKSSRYPSGGQTRLLRLHIARIHAGMALAEAVLAACEDGSLDESSELVLRCLHRVALRLGRRESHGFPQRDLVRQVADGAREHYAGQVDTIVRLQEQLDSAPGNRHLLRLAEHYSGGTLIYYEGDLVAGDKYKITTNGDGNVVTAGKDNQVHVETVTTTTNEPQLTDLIAELMQEVARLSAELGDDATNAEDAANGLSREAAEPQPDAGRMSRRLERLREIAAKLGDAGLKVIDIVSKISQLIPG
jgi:hypothetical protein